MPGFNFLFEAFVLLMGLAMAEVLRGFARVLKLRTRRKAGLDGGEPVRIGWLVPLLGLFVILDQSTFFLHMYGYRTIMPFNVGTMMGILLAIGWYYLVASMTFPDEPQDWPDFDEWYWRQKRFVIGGVLGINALSITASILLVTPEAQQAAAAQATPQQAIANLFALTVLPAMIWAFFAKGYRTNLVLLGYMILNPLVYGALVIGTQPLA